MKKLVKDLEPRFERVSPRDALGWISRLKQDLKRPDAEEAPGSGEEETYRALWGRYHETLLRASAVDFDDLLALPARLLQEHEEVRDRYGRRYSYVLIDEYQDTNHAQYEIARLLASVHGNLFVVGDEDQSIYSWRGADIRNILAFEQDFPEAKVFRLEQNYRSTQPILSAANAVVANNTERLGKTLWTSQTKGAPARVYEAEDSEDEARFVAEEVEAAKEYGQTAVLYRTNGQARLIEEAFRRRSIPYVVIGGVRFYGRKEIKDLLAYLRLAVNGRDDVSLRRVVNVPPRGLGATTLAQLEEYAAERGCSLLEVLRDIEHDQTFRPLARDSAARFVELVDDLALRASQSEEVAPLIKELIERIAYADYLKKADERDYRTRLEAVDEFVSACAQADQREPKGLAGFLQDLSLLTDVDDWDTSAETVTLMTCHSAKGLEFERVFLIGLEEGLLPHASAVGADSDVEEERRLCYVAMTRARKHLMLTYARSRFVYGERRGCEPSRFLAEIPAGMLDFAGREEPEAPSRTARPPGPPRAATDRLKMGSRVRHAKFGTGVVMWTSGSGKKLKARIRFASGRSREFMVSVAPLELLDEDR